MLTTEQAELLKAWKQWHEYLATAKKAEATLRMQVVQMLGIIEGQEGTTNIETNVGKVKVKSSLNYKVVGTNEQVEALRHFLPFEIDQIFKKRYEVSVSGYKALLLPQYAKNISELIEIKPGMPSLEMEN